MMRNPVSSALWNADRFCWDLSERGLIMGILNITPDSFSDGGKFHEVDHALTHARQMVAEGADILDIGGESTRPGAAHVPLTEELARVVPVVEALRAECDCALSIDTTKPEVARAAIAAGADIVNDISGFRNPDMIDVCASTSCGLVAMHMQGTPQTMQINPSYDDLLGEVSGAFEKIDERLGVAGITRDRVLYDPGIGFGKSIEHNLTILRHLDRLCLFDRPLLMGLSRKSFIGHLLGRSEMALRENPTIALTAYTRAKGALVHRVHRVKENREALRMTEALLS